MGKGTALDVRFEPFRHGSCWPSRRGRVKVGRRADLAKAVLNSNKDAGAIALDSETTLSGVPTIAWSYLLGNRCAIDWVLDQHKEKTPKDPTIREKFNTYRFADHKEKVIGLRKRVTTVSVETMQIVNAMRAEPRRKDEPST